MEVNKMDNGVNGSYGVRVFIFESLMAMMKSL